MKALLEFNLPEEQEDFDLAVDAWRWRAVVALVLDELRPCREYGDIDDIDWLQRIDALWNDVHAEMCTHGISLD